MVDPVAVFVLVVGSVVGAVVCAVGLLTEFVLRALELFFFGAISTCNDVIVIAGG